MFSESSRALFSDVCQGFNRRPGAEQVLPWHLLLLGKNFVATGLEKHRLQAPWLGTLQFTSGYLSNKKGPKPWDFQVNEFEFYGVLYGFYQFTSTKIIQVTDL